VSGLLVGAPLSLSGRYALQGRLAAAGLQQAVQDVRTAGGGRMGDIRLVPDLLILDDGSTRDGARRALEGLQRAHLLVGPYGTDLVEEAARWAGERRRVLWNHGGSADEVQRLPGLVSVASPVSRYLAAVLEALAEHLPGARVLVVAGRGRFGLGAAEGALHAAGCLGMRLVGPVVHRDVPDRPDTDVLLAAGSFDEDLALLGRLCTRPPVVAAVAAGMSRFGLELGGGSEGVLGPSQWEEGVHFPVDLGPRQADVVRALRARVVPALRAERGAAHIDYPAAQAYAAGLVALRCAEQAGALDDGALERAAAGLRCTTFFGRFGLGPDRVQVDHEILVVQWRDGLKRVVWPRARAEAALEM
jgi:ABC-type branched-subunit amino acid transport system substrate-binding protein